MDATAFRTRCGNFVLLRYSPLLVRTLVAPWLGAVLFAVFLIAASGFSWRGSFLAMGWICLAVYFGLRYPSWSVVGTSALIIGGASMALLPRQLVPASLLLGFAVHCLYALTKVRCATIGCCNFYAYGVFGKGTLARRLNLARLEVAASLALAAMCVFALAGFHLNPGWLLVGFVGHGCIRSISWRLRHAGPIGSRLWSRGDEVLACAVLIQAVLVVRSSWHAS